MVDIEPSNKLSGKEKTFLGGLLGIVGLFALYQVIEQRAMQPVLLDKSEHSILYGSCGENDFHSVLRPSHSSTILMPNFSALVMTDHKPTGAMRWSMVDTGNPDINRVEVQVGNDGETLKGGLDCPPDWRTTLAQSVTESIERTRDEVSVFFYGS